MDKEEGKLRLLKALEAAGKPLMMRECAERLGVSHPTSAKVVMYLEGAGLVKVIPRATMKEVELTPRGREWLARQRR